MRVSPNSFLNNNYYNTDTFTECVGPLASWINNPSQENQNAFMQQARKYPAIWTIKNSKVETIYSYVIAFHAPSDNKAIVLDELLRQAMLNMKLKYALTALNQNNHCLFYQANASTMQSIVSGWVEFAMSRKFINANDYAAIHLLPDNILPGTSDYFNQLNSLFEIYATSRLRAMDFQALFLRPNSEGKRLLSLAIDSRHPEILRFILDKGKHYLTQADYAEMLLNKAIPEVSLCHQLIDTKDSNLLVIYFQRLLDESLVNPNVSLDDIQQVMSLTDTRDKLPFIERAINNDSYKVALVVLMLKIILFDANPYSKQTNQNIRLFREEKKYRGLFVNEIIIKECKHLCSSNRNLIGADLYDALEWIPRAKDLMRLATRVQSNNYMHDLSDETYSMRR